MAERGKFLEGLIYPFYQFPEVDPGNKFDEANKKVKEIIQEFEQKLRDNRIRYTVSTFTWSIRIYISKNDKHKIGKDLMWELEKIHNKQHFILSDDDSQNAQGS